MVGFPANFPAAFRHLPEKAYLKRCCKYGLVSSRVAVSISTLREM